VTFLLYGTSKNFIREEADYLMPSGRIRLSGRQTQGAGPSGSELLYEFVYKCCFLDPDKRYYNIKKNSLSPLYNLDGFMQPMNFFPRPCPDICGSQQTTVSYSTDDGIIILQSPGTTENFPDAPACVPV
jgi:hypothetical protein